MLCTTLDFSEYVGRIAIGRIVSGRSSEARRPRSSRPAAWSCPGRSTACLLFDKLGRVEVEQAEAGDIVAIVGLASVEIGDTIADPELTTAPCPGSRSTNRP